MIIENKKLIEIIKNKDLKEINKAFKKLCYAEDRIGKEQIESLNLVDENCLKNPLYQKVNEYIENSTNGLKGYLENFNKRMHQRKIKADEYGLISRIFLNMDENGAQITPMSTEDKLRKLQLYANEYNLKEINEEEKEKMNFQFNERSEYFQRLNPTDRLKTTQSSEEKLSGLELVMKKLGLGEEVGLDEHIFDLNLNLERFENTYKILEKKFEEHLGNNDVIGGLVELRQQSYPNSNIRREDVYRNFANLVRCSVNRVNRVFDLLDEFKINLLYVPASFLTDGYDDAKTVCKRIKINQSYVTNNSSLKINELPKNIFTKDEGKFIKLIAKYEKLK